MIELVQSFNWSMRLQISINGQLLEDEIQVECHKARCTSHSFQPPMTKRCSATVRDMESVGTYFVSHALQVVSPWQSHVEID